VSGLLGGAVVIIAVHTGRLRAAIVVAALTAAVACAPISVRPAVDPALVAAEVEKQRELVVADDMTQSTRLWAVQYRLSVTGVGLCDRMFYSIGVFWVHLDAYHPEYRAVAARVLKLGDAWTAMGVFEGSPAARAGLRAGDQLIAIGGWHVSADAARSGGISRKINELAQGGRPVAMTVRRDGAELELPVSPMLTCDYPASVLDSQITNAFADGRRIMVTTGMMRFARTEVELATVVGHEMAHNAMHHMDARTANAFLGALADALLASQGGDTEGIFAQLGAQMYSQEFEAEADYVGLYLMARAGYPIDQAPQFWRRMGVQFPADIESNHAATHPPTPERFVALAATVAEIDRKIAAGQPLTPEINSSVFARIRPPGMSR
jgi:beta-barrel assembly-enhancing protease